ncbi:MAG: spore coat associated protein CotJA [Clostridia bacterium]|nr:spore coat associated protein CotJA [Clostridia bacterium]
MENLTENTTSCTLCKCVGYGYVPIQTLGETYAPAKALMQGTIFPELDLTIEEYGKVCKEGRSI